MPAFKLTGQGEFRILPDLRKESRSQLDMQQGNDRFIYVLGPLAPDEIAARRVASEEIPEAHISAIPAGSDQPLLAFVPAQYHVLTERARDTAFLLE
jgi:hypothetical protein